MRYILKPIIYLVWWTIVQFRDGLLLIGILLWYFDYKKGNQFLESRIPLLFTEGRTMRYRYYTVVYVTLGYASLMDFIHSKKSYYYLDGSVVRLGKVGDLHWQHCDFSEPRS